MDARPTCSPCFLHPLWEIEIKTGRPTHPPKRGKEGRRALGLAGLGSGFHDGDWVAFLIPDGWVGGGWVGGWKEALCLCDLSSLFLIHAPTLPPTHPYLKPTVPSGVSRVKTF